MSRYNLAPKAGASDLSITVGWDAEHATYHAHVRRNLPGAEAFTYLLIGLGEPVTDAPRVVDELAFFAEIPEDLLENLITDRLNTLPLADLIAEAPDGQPPAWRDAHRLAVDELGCTLPLLINWTDIPDTHGRVLGTINGTDRSLTLRYQPDSEAGDRSLWLQIPCPHHIDCPGPAWGRFRGRHTLLHALTTGEADYTWCVPHNDGHDVYQR
ncbi:hypothetical protein [Dactylosporangium sp. CA-139066]|uniref:hypothetical protein n=1 Tax=Dactylosporangium sp. CA-139066 TaxID=3239930 RepID=UPI003D932D80